MPLDTELPMNTTALSRRLGVPVTVDLMTELGFTPCGHERRASLWNPNEYPAMNDALCKYIAGRRNIGPVEVPPTAPRKKKGEDKPAASGKPAADYDPELDDPPTSGASSDDDDL